MKKTLFLTVIFLSLLLSCEKDDTTLVEAKTFDTEKIWEYSGNTKVLEKIIKKVKQSTEGRKLEQDVNRSSVLWNKGEFILINNKKHILFPVLNIKKNKIRGLVSFSQKNISVIKQDTKLGKSIKKQKIDINYTFINRWDLSKRDKTFPFWTKSIMRGYFDALDKDILGKQNHSKGIVKNEMPEERKKAFLEQQKLIRSLSSGYYEEHCIHTFIEHCILVPTFESDEVEYVEDVCYIEVEEDCYSVWVEGEEEEEDCFDETDPNCPNYDICAVDPCACENCDDYSDSSSSNDDIVCKGCEDEKSDIDLIIDNLDELIALSEFVGISSLDDIVIWYVDENGENKSFIYKGNNGDKAPNNDFVKDVLSSLCNNCSNGGGLAGIAAANDSNAIIEIARSSTRSFSTGGTQRNLVYWNPNNGLMNENGQILSPSTVLEHEIDHAYHKATNSKEHQILVERVNDNFTNEEEKRVILGNETITAVANGEVPDGSNSREHHGEDEGIRTVFIEDPTSTEVDEEKTKILKQRIEEERDSWTSE